MRHLLASGAPDAFKLFVLDNYLEELRGTLYRQGLFAEFELALHEQVEQGLSLTPEWLDRTCLELTRQYYGHDQGVVRVEDLIQAEWSAIPHFYMDFYVFQCATSMSASMALAKAMAEEGAPARDRYLRLLRSGGSRFPVAALRDAGRRSGCSTAWWANWRACGNGPGRPAPPPRAAERGVHAGPPAGDRRDGYCTWADSSY